MNISLNSIWNSIWTRNSKGENYYYLPANNDWGGLSGTNLEIAQSHPVLTPAMLFVSKVYSQARFKVENIDTGKEVKNHWLINLLNNPNYYQTRQDLLEQLMFVMIANGSCILWAKKIRGFTEPKNSKALIILDQELIKWPENFSFGIGETKESLSNKEIIYDENGENISIPIVDLLFFYDLPNGLQKNKFKTKSRLAGLKQTLINTNDSLLAKNIILKTNGKELISGVKDGFPLTPEEKEGAESLFNNKYGLSQNRKRGLVTKSSLSWQSMHIALRDLGLDESVKTDGNIIYTALHIPKDILSLEAKKTTYNNFKESMVSYIQNEHQASLDSFVAVLQKIMEPNLKLVGSYEHMPIMQYILIERYDGILKKGNALKSLLEAGIPDEIALELCGFSKDIKLNKKNSNGQQENESEQQS